MLWMRIMCKLGAALGLLRDDRMTLLVDENEAGSVRRVQHRDRGLLLKIPAQGFRDGMVLRESGGGKYCGGRVMDLLVTLRFRRGPDTRTDLWLSEEEAERGGRFRVRLDPPVNVKIPERVVDAHESLLRGAGKLPTGIPEELLPDATRGDAIVRVRTYSKDPPLRLQERVLDSMSTEELALEGRVLGWAEALLTKIPGRYHGVGVSTSDVVHGFNVDGWRGVYDILAAALVADFKVDQPIATKLPERVAGRCTTSVVETVRDNRASEVALSHRIEISQGSIASPFECAAVLAHEMCHILYEEYVNRDVYARLRFWPRIGDEEQRLEVERNVDVLVCITGLSRFQLYTYSSEVRMGYFAPDTFARAHSWIQKRRSRNT